MQVFQQEIITRKLFQNIIIKQELYQPYKDNSVIVGIGSDVITYDYYLSEGIVNSFE